MIDHVIATDNNSGIGIDSSLATGGSTTVAISNSVASNNPGNGIYANTVNSLVLRVSIDGSKISGNGHGIDAEDSSQVFLGSSTITGNTVGVYNNAVPGLMSSWLNNQIAGNGQDGFGAQFLARALR